MSYEKLDGIVIKETNIGEADKIITILSPKKRKNEYLFKECKKA